MLTLDIKEKVLEALRVTGVVEASLESAKRLLNDLLDELPEQINNDEIGKVIERQIDKVKRNAAFSQPDSNINFLPSDYLGPCRDLLVVECADEVEFDKLMPQTYASCIHCRHVRKAVLIISTYWTDKDYENYRRKIFEALCKEFGITFIVVKLQRGKITTFIMQRKLSASLNEF